MVIRCCKTCLNRIEVEITEDDIKDKEAYVWNRYLQNCKADHGLISNLEMKFETPTECKDYQQTGFYDDAHTHVDIHRFLWSLSRFLILS